MALEQIGITEIRRKWNKTLIDLSVWTNNKADALTATPAGSFITIEIEMWKIVRQTGSE